MLSFLYQRFFVVFMGSVRLWVGLGPGSKFSLWYGLGWSFGGLGWVGLNKLDPRTTLVQVIEEVLLLPTEM